MYLLEFFWIGRTFECDEGLRCMYVHHRRCGIQRDLLPLTLFDLVVTAPFDDVNSVSPINIISNVEAKIPPTIKTVLFIPTHRAKFSSTLLFNEYYESWRIFPSVSDATVTRVSHRPQRRELLRQKMLSKLAASFPEMIVSDFDES